MPSRAKKLLRRVAGVLDADDALDAARSLLGRVPDTPLLSGIGATPRQVFDATRTGYRYGVDPAREVFETSLDVRGVLPTLTSYAPGRAGPAESPEVRRRLAETIGDTRNPVEVLERTGQAWRERPQTLRKAVVESTIDPLNALLAGPVPATAGKGAVARILLRDLALGPVGLTVGDVIGRRLGGEEGAATGRVVGGLASLPAAFALSGAGVRGAATVAEAGDELTRARRALAEAGPSVRGPSGAMAFAEEAGQTPGITTGRQAVTNADIIERLTGRRGKKLTEGAAGARRAALAERLSAAVAEMPEFRAGVAARAEGWQRLNPGNPPFREPGDWRREADIRLSQLFANWADWGGAGAAGHQMAAVQEFGISPSTLDVWNNTMSGSFVTSFDHPQYRMKAEADAAAIRPLLRFIYDQTQHLLTENGVERVRLYRGVVVTGRAPLATGDVIETTLMPLTSFTLDPRIARRFASDLPPGRTGAIMTVDVPIQRIVSTPRTGFGSAEEAEIALLGGPIRARVDPVGAFRSDAAAPMDMFVLPQKKPPGIVPPGALGVAPPSGSLGEMPERPTGPWRVASDEDRARFEKLFGPSKGARLLIAVENELWGSLVETSGGAAAGFAYGDENTDLRTRLRNAAIGALVGAGVGKSAKVLLDSPSLLRLIDPLADRAAARMASGNWTPLPQELVMNPSRASAAEEIARRSEGLPSRMGTELPVGANAITPSRPPSPPDPAAELTNIMDEVNDTVRRALATTAPQQLDPPNAAAQIVNSVIAPARNLGQGANYTANPRTPTGSLLVREAIHHNSELVACTARNWARDLAGSLGTVQTAPGAQIDTLIASATDPAKRANYQALRGTLADIVENPTDYHLTPQQQQIADQFKGLYAAERGAETTAGIDTSASVADYVNHAWQEKPPRTGTTGRVRTPVGVKQSFQQARTVPTYRQGIDVGLTPTTLDPGDLVEMRILAGQRAIGDRAYIELAKTTPGVLLKSTDPRVKGGDYRRVNLPWLERHFPMINTGELTRVIDEVATGVLSPQEAKRAVGTEVVSAGHQYLMMRADWAQALENATKGSITDIKAARVVQTGAEAFQQTVLSADWYFGGQTLLNSLLHSVSLFDPLHPVSSASRVASGIYGVFGDALPRAILGGRFFDAWVESPEARFWALHGLGNTPRSASVAAYGAEVARGPLSRLPVVGPLFRYLDDSQFTRLVPSVKTKMASISYEMAQQLNPGADPDILARQIADRIDHGFGGTSTTKLGLSRTQQAVERTTLVAGNYWRSRLMDITDIRRTGVEGMLARRYWGTVALTAFGGSILSGLIALEAADQLTPENVAAMFSWDDPASVINPDSRAFMQFRVGDVYVNPYGSARTMVKSLLSPITEGMTDYRNAADEGIAAQVVAAAHGFGIDGADRLWTYVQQRKSIPLGVAYDLVRNRDFRGRAIISDESSLPPELQGLRYVSAKALPATGQSLIGMRALDEAEGFEPGRAAGQWLGVTVTPQPNDPAAVQDTIRRFLSNQGINPTTNPISRFKRGEGIDADVRSRFLRDNPAVADYLSEKSRKPSELPASPQGRDAARLYSATRESLQAWRKTELERIGREAISGDDYRRRSQDVRAAYVNQLRGAAMQLFGSNDLNTAQAYIDRAYGGKEKARGPVQRLLDEYYAIEMEGDSEDARQRFFDERRAFFDRIGPESTAKVKEVLRNEAPTAMEREYQESQDAFGEAMALSPYVGIDPKLGRRISQVFTRAADRQQMYGGAIKQRQAILMDADSEGAAWAYLIAKNRGRWANPERKQLLNRPIVLKYYSSVPSDELRLFLQESA